MWQYNKEELNSAIDFMDKLTHKVDPISNISLPEDTVLNNKKYNYHFRIVVGALTFLQKNSSKLRNSSNKESFFLTDNEKELIKPTNDAISISQFTYIINSKVDLSNMKKLKATQITKWLNNKGYLINNINITKYKICSNMAIEIGMTTVKKMNTNGKEYVVTLYNAMAQEFILNNINTIVTEDENGN